MKGLLTIIGIVLASSTVFANDGGIAAIKVDQIKMRETALRNGQSVLVRKIANPSFTITLEGGEARKLQQILPSESSVVTAMNPGIANEFKESFKSLGIYSDKSTGVTSKVLTISCSDATLSEDGSRITKTGKSVCTISINAVSDESGAADYFGDMQSFEPKSCH